MGNSPLNAAFWELYRGAVGTVFLMFTISAMISHDCGACRSNAFFTVCFTESSPCQWKIGKPHLQDDQVSGALEATPLYTAAEKYLKMDTQFLFLYHSHFPLIPE